VRPKNYNEIEQKLFGTISKNREKCVTFSFILQSLRKMIDLKRYVIILILILLSYSKGQQSQCDSGYCDDQIHCDLGFCCNNTCVDVNSPNIKTQNKGESCSLCKGCKGTLCCEKGTCLDACGTTKGEYKCGCTNSTDCNAFWLTGVKYACVQGQVSNPIW
jgi:hypothetical protein